MQWFGPLAPDRAIRRTKSHIPRQNRQPFWENTLQSSTQKARKSRAIVFWFGVFIHLLGLAFIDMRVHCISSVILLFSCYSAAIWAMRKVSFSFDKRGKLQGWNKRQHKKWEFFFVLFCEIWIQALKFWWRFFVFVFVFICFNEGCQNTPREYKRYDEFHRTRTIFKSIGSYNVSNLPFHETSQDQTLQEL